MQTEYPIVSKQAVTVFSVRDKKERHRKSLFSMEIIQRKLKCYLCIKQLTIIRDNAHI